MSFWLINNRSHGDAAPDTNLMFIKVGRGEQNVVVPSTRMIQPDENNRFIVKKKWHVDVNGTDSSRQRNIPVSCFEEYRSF